jgi:hypothetical protein
MISEVKIEMVSINLAEILKNRLLSIETSVRSQKIDNYCHILVQCNRNTLYLSGTFKFIVHRSPSLSWAGNEDYSVVSVGWVRSIHV